MAKKFDLKKGELTRHVTKAAKAIADGYIIVIPMENSYAFACDAFRADTVRAMHVSLEIECSVSNSIITRLKSADN